MTSKVLRTLGYFSIPSSLRSLNHPLHLLQMPLLLISPRTRHLAQESIRRPIDLPGYEDKGSGNRKSYINNNNPL